MHVDAGNHLTLPHDALSLRNSHINLYRYSTLTFINDVVSLSLSFRIISSVVPLIDNTSYPSMKAALDPLIPVQ